MILLLSTLLACDPEVEKQSDTGSDSEGVEAKLELLKNLHEKGLISTPIYEQRVRDIIGSI